MSYTVLITGCSSGIGKAVAQKFLREGWNVVATARNPKNIELEGEQLLKLELDVTEPQSIKKAFADTFATFETLDVVVNNAGYGLLGILEEAKDEKIQKQFDTNVFGHIRVMQSALSHMRKRASGTIINITSMGGRATFPYYSLYHGTKFAMEGISESAYFELQAIGIKIKVVEPGMIRTDFYGRSMNLQETELPEYRVFQERVKKYVLKPGPQASEPAVVADVVFRAATDGRSKFRYTAGLDALLLTQSRKFLPDWSWRLMTKLVMRI